MPLVLKLIAQFQQGKSFEIRDNYTGFINLGFFHQLFAHFGITQEEMSLVKFITESEYMSDLDKQYFVKSNEDRCVMIYTTNTVIKNKLAAIFMKEGTEVIKPGYAVSSALATTQSAQTFNPDPNICKPITIVKSEPPPKLTPDIIDVMNAKSVSLFSDPDFKSLIGIYLRRPELFGTLSQYVQNGNVLEESLGNTKTIDDLTDDEFIQYKGMIDKISQLGINISETEILDKLIKFSGHLNLTLRSILCDIAKDCE
jgi:hypothetical protein